MSGEIKKSKEGGGRHGWLTASAYLSSALLLCGGGGWLAYNGLNQPPEHTPDISVPKIAPPSQAPVGPKTAKVTDSSKKEEGEKEVAPTTLSPNKLFIPSIKTLTSVDNSKDLGKSVDGEFMLPEASLVTRSVTGAKVGDKAGTILIAGHVNTDNERGALYDLANIPLGALAYVSGDDGKIEEYQLSSMVPIKKTALPDDIWRKDGEKRLVIVTCGGELVKVADGSYHFESNIVSYWKPTVQQKSKVSANSTKTTASKK